VETLAEMRKRGIDKRTMKVEKEKNTHLEQLRVHQW